MKGCWCSQANHCVFNKKKIPPASILTCDILFHKASQIDLLMLAFSLERIYDSMYQKIRGIFSDIVNPHLNCLKARRKNCTSFPFMTACGKLLGYNWLLPGFISLVHFMKRASVPNVLFSEWKMLSGRLNSAVQTVSISLCSWCSCKSQHDHFWLKIRTCRRGRCVLRLRPGLRDRALIVFPAATLIKAAVIFLPRIPCLLSKQDGRDESKRWWSQPQCL